jgi:hypothetical protein
MIKAFFRRHDLTTEHAPESGKYYTDNEVAGLLAQFTVTETEVAERQPVKSRGRPTKQAGRGHRG